MTEDRTALVLGATGGIGGALARGLIARGWRVRGLHRHPETLAGAGLEAVTWHRGDAMRAQDVIAAAAGARIIVHGLNPPGYRRWRELALPMLDNSIAAAKASGARILFPGNIYNFGPEAWPRLREDSPQTPLTRKGAIRVEMERRLAAASRDGVRSLIVRAGDFFDSRPGSNWFSGCLVKPGRPLRRIVYPGLPEAGHAWAWLPDLAETFLRLIEREGDLAAAEMFHFGGHWFDHGIDMARAIQRAAGTPTPPIHGFPWPLVFAGAPFVTLFREMIEMRYLWRRSIRLDNSKLVAFLGAEPHTPLDQAIVLALEGVGCRAGVLRGAAPHPAGA